MYEMVIIGGKYFSRNRNWNLVGVRYDHLHGYRAGVVNQTLKWSLTAMTLTWWAIISVGGTIIISAFILAWFEQYSVMNWLVDTIYRVLQW